MSSLLFSIIAEPFGLAAMAMDFSIRKTVMTDKLKHAVATLAIALSAVANAQAGEWIRINAILSLCALFMFA